MDFIDAQAVLGDEPQPPSMILLGNHPAVKNTAWPKPEIQNGTETPLIGQCEGQDLYLQRIL
ncbi:MAG TPA: hypothetical protein P5186_02380 [Candidatus Paceibacterota bacterium]|nr:hypothetical protein [Verrucomicrobiota bacterium]HRY46869.1 hypothetical protein [Candidatus Paceibacterota bacterium]HSA02128.1 hypothetical protein [Candidatus Paceibacterota bacterium]